MVGADAVRICFRKRSMGMALLLLFIALCVMPTQAVANTYAELDDGVYTITNVIADKSLDVAGGYCVNGSNVQVYEGNHTYAQAWRISKKGSSYSIENSITGMVLDVAGGSKIAGANAQLYDSNNTQAQRWKFVQNADGSYSIRSDCNSLFLDVAGGSKKTEPMSAFIRQMAPRRKNGGSSASPNLLKTAPIVFLPLCPIKR